MNLNDKYLTVKSSTKSIKQNNVFNLFIIIMFYLNDYTFTINNYFKYKW